MEKRKRIALWTFLFVVIGLIAITYVKRSYWEEPQEVPAAADKR